MICALALVLMMDASSSVYQTEWQQQVHYTAAAIRSEEVIDAIEKSPGIAVMAGAFNNRGRELMGWQVLRTRQDAEDFANRLEATRRPFDGSTSINGALTFALEQIENAPCEPDQSIIDISTDGISNDAEETGQTRDRAQALGVRINAIAVASSELDNFDMLRDYAITFDGFLLEANGWANYPAMFRRKIVMELTMR